MKSFFFFFFLSITFSFSQITNELLDKAIAYHDQNNNWAAFNNKLNVTMQIPNKSNRASEIYINLPNDYFNLKVTQNKSTTQYKLDKEKCTIKLNGESNLDKKTRLSSSIDMCYLG